jgi:hypothetical protein
MKKVKLNAMNYEERLQNKLNEKKINITQSNSKLSSIASFGTLPTANCHNGTCINSTSLCRKFCYVNGHNELSRKLSEKLNLTVNTYMINNHIDLTESQLVEFLSTYTGRYFRISYSGDIHKQEIVAMWYRIITKFPEIHFLCFTKSITLNWNNKPSNLSLVLSVFPDSKIDKVDLSIFDGISYAIFPLSNNEKNERANIYNDSKYHYSNDKYNEIANTSIACSGSCETCQVCWHLKKLDKNVYFHIHGSCFHTLVTNGQVIYPI